MPPNHLILPLKAELKRKISRHSGWIRDATGQIILLCAKQLAGAQPDQLPERRLANAVVPFRNPHFFCARIRDPLTFLYSAVCQNHRMRAASWVAIETGLLSSHPSLKITSRFTSR